MKRIDWHYANLLQTYVHAGSKTKITDDSVSRLLLGNNNSIYLNFEDLLHSQTAIL